MTYMDVIKGKHKIGGVELFKKKKRVRVECRIIKVQMNKNAYKSYV